MSFLHSLQTISVCCTALLQRTVWWLCLSLSGKASTFSWVALSPLRTSGLERKNWTLKWARVQVREMCNELLAWNILLWKTCFNYIILFCTIQCNPVFSILISEILVGLPLSLQVHLFFFLRGLRDTFILFTLNYYGCLHLLLFNLFLFLYILPSIIVLTLILFLTTSLLAFPLPSSFFSPLSHSHSFLIPLSHFHW